jgi:hypothetical protein
MAVVNQNFNTNPIKSKTIHGFCLVLSFIGICSSIFLHWFYSNLYNYNNFASHLYGAIHRDIWAISWAYILLACINGKLQTINWLLSIGVFKLIGLISFQAYLHHWTVMRFVSLNAKTFSNDTYNLVLVRNSLNFSI